MKTFPSRNFWIDTGNSIEINVMRVCFGTSLLWVAILSFDRFAWLLIILGCLIPLLLLRDPVKIGSSYCFLSSNDSFLFYSDKDKYWVVSREEIREAWRTGRDLNSKNKYHRTPFVDGGAELRLLGNLRYYVAKGKDKIAHVTEYPPEKVYESLGDHCKKCNSPLIYRGKKKGIFDVACWIGLFLAFTLPIQLYRMYLPLHYEERCMYLGIAGVLLVGSVWVLGKMLIFSKRKFAIVTDSETFIFYASNDGSFLAERGEITSKKSLYELLMKRGSSSKTLRRFPGPEAAGIIEKILSQWHGERG